LNNDKSTNGGETGNYITIDSMVELVTINKALPRDSPNYLKKINKYIYKKSFLPNNRSKNMF
jgi:hypothetical protein